MVYGSQMSDKPDLQPPSDSIFLDVFDIPGSRGFFL